MSEMIIITGILAGLGGFLGYIFTKSRAKSTHTLREENKDLKALVELKKKEARSYKSKLANSHTLPKVADNFDLSEASGIEGLIGSLLPKITDRFPELKGLVGSEDIAQVAKLAKEHPEVVEKLLSKFIQKKSTKDSSQEGEGVLAV